MLNIRYSPQNENPYDLTVEYCRKLEEKINTTGTYESLNITESMHYDYCSSIEKRVKPAYVGYIEAEPIVIRLNLNNK